MKRLGSPLSALVLGLALAACGDGAQSASTSEPPTIDQRIREIFPSDPSFGAVNREQVRRMLETPPEEDGPFYMVNLIKHREFAEYADGRETNLTGEEAAAIYGSLALPILSDIGARPVFVAHVDLNLIGDGTSWDQVAVVLYPSRAQFLEMAASDALRDAGVHKQAGVEKSLVLVATVDGDGIPDALRQLDLTTVPTPPTPENPPIAMIHLLDYHELAQYEDGRDTTLTGREAMTLYEQGRQDQGVLELGVRPGLWLLIEGELVGDGRVWDEFRINNFPNRDTFFQIGNADSFDEAGGEHREAALNDTYSMLTAPLITEVGYD